MPDKKVQLTDLAAEQHKIYKGVGAALFVSAIVLGGAHLYLHRLFQFPDTSLEARLIFWASGTLVVIFWVVLGIGMVSRGRRRSPEDIWGSAYSAPSPRIAVAVAFLQNTLEQAVLAAFASLALVLLLPDKSMPLIAALVLLFCIGRAAFLVSYPDGAGARSFGMALTMLPSLMAVGLALAIALLRIWQSAAW